MRVVVGLAEKNLCIKSRRSFIRLLSNLWAEAIRPRWGTLGAHFDDVRRMSWHTHKPFIIKESGRQVSQQQQQQEEQQEEEEEHCKSKTKTKTTAGRRRKLIINQRNAARVREGYREGRCAGELQMKKKVMQKEMEMQKEEDREPIKPKRAQPRSDLCPDDRQS